VFYFKYFTCVYVLFINVSVIIRFRYEAYGAVLTIVIK